MRGFSASGLQGAADLPDLGRSLGCFTFSSGAAPFPFFPTPPPVHSRLWRDFQAALACCRARERSTLLAQILLLKK